MLVDIFITPCICIRICKLVYPTAGERSGGGGGGTPFTARKGGARGEGVWKCVPPAGGGGGGGGGGYSL